MFRTSAVVSLGLLGILGSLPAQSAAGVIYRDDFEASTMSPYWSTNSKLNSQYYSSFTQFNGRYTGEQITLKLNNVPPPGQGSDGDDHGGGIKHNLFTLTFDFYCIDSWDGSDTTKGPDRFLINANTVPIFDETFSNVGTSQSFRRPDIGPKQLGFDQRWNDSIYRKVKVDFTVAPDAPHIKLAFSGTALQGISDESWGIDNIEVSYQIVPAPGVFALAAGGGIIGLRRQRRANEDRS